MNFSFDWSYIHIVLVLKVANASSILFTRTKSLFRPGVEATSDNLHKFHIYSDGRWHTPYQLLTPAIWSKKHNAGAGSEVPRSKRDRVVQQLYCKCRLKSPVSCSLLCTCISSNKEWFTGLQLLLLKVEFRELRKRRLG